MLRAPGLEIDVPGQVVGKEAQPQLEGQETDAVVEVGVVLGAQEAPGPGEVAREDGLGQIGLKTDRFPVPGFLPQGIAAGAQAVAVARRRTPAAARRAL